MTPKCHQISFEAEVENYKKMTGVAAVPELKAVVRKPELVHGLLMYYIEGSDLLYVIQNGDIPEEELLNITYRIMFNGPKLSDALFTLGRTVWELWAAESPSKGAHGAPLDRVRKETARNIIDCEEET
jgi:hypothetical protein